MMKTSANAQSKQGKATNKAFVITNIECLDNSAGSNTQQHPSRLSSGESDVSSKLTQDSSDDELMERLNGRNNTPDDGITHLRKQMIEEIIRRFESRQDKMNPAQRKNIPEVAKKLEAHLFAKSDGSLELYRDHSTLNKRFQGIITAMLWAKLSKAQAKEEIQERTDSPSFRLEVLAEQGVAPELVRQIYFLVRQIEYLQTGTPLDTTRLGATQTKCSLNLQGQIPQQVRAIFFDAPIVSTFYCTPLDRLADLNWPSLVKEAKKAVREYHQWVAGQKEATTASE